MYYELAYFILDPRLIHIINWNAKYISKFDSTWSLNYLCFHRFGMDDGDDSLEDDSSCFVKDDFLEREYQEAHRHPHCQCCAHPQHYQCCNNHTNSNSNYSVNSTNSQQRQPPSPPQQTMTTHYHCDKEDRRTPLSVWYSNHIILSPSWPITSSTTAYTGLYSVIFSNFYFSGLWLLDDFYSYTGPWLNMYIPCIYVLLPFNFFFKYPIWKIN